LKASGIFEVPVGPVHAGIYRPGHFRFSVAGEPIINLEARLDLLTGEWKSFFEGKLADEAVGLAERVFRRFSLPIAWHLCRALERFGNSGSQQALFLRGIFTELERMYNQFKRYCRDCFGCSFSFPATFAGILKNRFYRSTQSFCASRYLKALIAWAELRWI